MNRQKLQITRTIHEGKGFQSSVYEADWNGVRAAVKDFSKTPPLFRFFVAPLLVSREIKALQHLQGASCVPQFLGKVHRVCFAMEYVEGKSVATFHPGQTPPDIFGAIQKSIDEIHARGVAHGDIKRRSNLLCAPDGKIWIIDFAAAVVARGALSRKLMQAVAEVDNKSVPRMKSKVAPELLTDEDKLKLENPTTLERWAKRLLGR